MTTIDPALLEGVELLSLDAGNTVIFLDHARLAEIAQRNGFTVDTSTLIRCEGEAKRAIEDDTLCDVAWDAAHLPGARPWGAMVGTILHRAGAPAAMLPGLVTALWHEHVALNLWSLVPPGLGVALDAVRERGVRVAIVSNSEGMLDVLFARLGIAKHFDLVVDSGKAGVEKPDARIFRIAMDALGAAPSRTLHLGDTVATDIVGARNAFARFALIDPFGHAEGTHLDVPRVPGVVAVADALMTR